MAETSSKTDPHVSSEDFTPAAVDKEEPVASTSTQIEADGQYNVDERSSNKESVESLYNRELSKTIHDIFGGSSSENEDQVEDLHVNSKSNSDGASSPSFSGVKRGPNKRQIKPTSHPELIDLDDIFAESSSDSDFCVTDHYVNDESDSTASNLIVSEVNNESTSTLTALKPSAEFSMRHDNSSVIKDHEMHLKLNNKCGICDRCNDQHLLAKCDTCNLYCHLGCLDPPLSRMPKKTKFSGWQCSECSNIESDCKQTVNPNSFRQLKCDDTEQSTSGRPRSSSTNNDYSTSLQEQKLVSGTSNGTIILQYRQRREKCSPELLKSHKGVKSCKRKRKQKRAKNLKSGSANDVINEPPRQGIKIIIKSVPSADNVETSHLVAVPLVDEIPQTFTNANPKKHVATKILSDIKITKCEICNITEMCSTMIQCDECSNHFHLSCLVPPLKKSPKSRGYSWHCTECDQTDSSD